MISIGYRLAALETVKVRKTFEERMSYSCEKPIGSGLVN